MVLIAGGAAVFVVASVITPLAGADTAAPRRHHEQAAQQGPAFTLDTAAGPTAVAPSSTPSSTATSTAASPSTTRAARLAPVDHTVISGLAANGIPSVALNAYRVAAARMASAEPSCGIRWALIAGIGREESDHGQFAGAVLHADGLSTPAIVGPPLNGKNGNRVIPAPADGLALDGDAKYAHALGPMQFIPSTWAIYGLDGDGDGRANIFDINDAALATARYLCAAGGDLTTHAGRVRAVFAYNHTDIYVAQVLALAQAYRTGTPITGLPQGTTSGKLPALGKAGKIPPANPGAPTANKNKHKKTLTSSGSSTPTPTRSTPTRPTRSTSHAPKPSRSPSKSPSPTPSTGHPSGSPSPTKSSSPTSSSPGPAKTCMVICLP